MVTVEIMNENIKPYGLDKFVNEATRERCSVNNFIDKYKSILQTLERIPNTNGDIYLFAMFFWQIERKGERERDMYMIEWSGLGDLNGFFLRFSSNLRIETNDWSKKEWNGSGAKVRTMK